MKRQGFTLIELLVVVLIIGILAAIALPQYQVSVAKSRLMQSTVLARAVYEAEEAYYLATGTYTADIENLDISIGEYTNNENNNDYSRNLISNKYSVNIAINGYGGVIDRVEVLMPGTLSGIGYYFENPSTQNHIERKGQIFCYGHDATYQQACVSMGGTYYGIIGGTTTKEYKLP